MKQLFIGIDNGAASGGLTALEEDGAIFFRSDFPAYTCERSGRKIIDVRNLAKRLQKLAEGFTIDVALENYHFAKNYKAACSMADCFASIRTVLNLLGIPWHAVLAEQWRARFWQEKQDDFKEAGLKLCREIWPKERWLAKPRSTTPHTGIYESALIAEWLRRKETRG